MASREADFELPRDLMPPESTPDPERRRLVAKGQRLAEHCLDEGSPSCIVGFIEHCLGQSPPQLDVIVDLWHALRRDYDRIGAGDVELEHRALLLKNILQHMTPLLQQALSGRRGEPRPDPGS